MRIGANTLLLFFLLALAERSPLVFVPILAALCHEAGHLAAMLAFGVKVQTVEITLFGAEIRSLPEANSNDIGQAVIYAAGAAANLVSGAFALYFGYDFFASCSFALAIVNMLPIGTLDGGCILTLILRKMTFRYAESILSAISAFFIFILWLAAVYVLLICHGNLSLMLFCAYMFVTLYLSE